MVPPRPDKREVIADVKRDSVHPDRINGARTQVHRNTRPSRMITHSEENIQHALVTGLISPSFAGNEVRQF